MIRENGVSDIDSSILKPTIETSVLMRPEWMSTYWVVVLRLQMVYMLAQHSTTRSPTIQRGFLRSALAIPTSAFVGREQTGAAVTPN